MSQEQSSQPTTTRYARKLVVLPVEHFDYLRADLKDDEKSSIPHDSFSFTTYMREKMKPEILAKNIDEERAAQIINALLKRFGKELSRTKNGYVTKKSVMVPVEEAAAVIAEVLQ